MAGLFDDLIPGAKPAKQDFGIFSDLVPPPPKPRSLAAVANDTVIETGNAIASAAAGIGNFIAPGNRVSKFIDENIVKAGEAAQSDAVKAEKARFNQEVQGADGVMGELGAVAGYIARNPLLTAAQAAGSFALPGAAVKGAGALARGLGAGAGAAANAGMAGGAVAGAALSGGDAAGTAYDLAIKAGATEEEAQAAARQASVIPAAVGGLGGVVGAERLLAGAGGVSGGAIARALKTAGIEGLQEGFEEGITQFEGQRAAQPFDPSIDPMKGVAAAAGMGAAMGGATGAAVSAFSGQPAVNVQARIEEQRADHALAAIGGATTADEAINAAMQAVPPVSPMVPSLDENAAMGRMEAQAADDEKQLKQFGRGAPGFTAPAGAGTQAAAAPPVAGGPAAQAQTSVTDSPFADRVMTLREQLQDDAVREQVRARFGDEAMREALYFASSADNPNIDLPEKTRERMLSLAETLVSQSIARPVQGQPQMAGQSAAARLQAPAAAPEVPRIGLDTTPTGTMRVNSAGQAAPETRADVISGADRERAAAQRPDGMTGSFPQGFPDRPGVMVGEGTLQAATFPQRQPAPPAAAEAPRALPAPQLQPAGELNGPGPAATGRPDEGSAGRGDQPVGSMEPARLLADEPGRGAGSGGAGEAVPSARPDLAAGAGRADDAVAPAPKTLRERAQAMKERTKAKKEDASAPQPTTAPAAGEEAAPVAAPARAAEADVSRAGSAGVEADGLKARAERMKARAAEAKPQGNLRERAEAVKARRANPEPAAAPAQADQASNPAPEIDASAERVDAAPTVAQAEPDEEAGTLQDIARSGGRATNDDMATQDVAGQASANPQPGDNQGASPVVSGSGDDLVTLYHGTTPDGLDAINADGKIEGTAYFTPNRSTARDYASANGGSDETIIRVSVPRSALGVDLDLPGGRLLDVQSANASTGNDDWTIDDYIRNGYSVGVEDGVYLRQPNEPTASEGSGAAVGGILADLNRIGTTIAAQGYEKAEVPRVQAARKLQGLIAKHEAGELSDGMFEVSVKLLAQRMTEASDAKQANRLFSERERGADIVREKLIRARRQGDMDPEAVEFALWAIDQNPAIAERLGISIRSPKDGTAAGDYNPAAEIIRLFKGSDATGTAVHEILHHTERMMPADMQEAIRREWAAALAKAMRNATPEQAAALENVIPAMAGDKAAYKALVKAIQEGPLNYEGHYQLTNPSEFWAVNATKLMADRFAARDSVWKRVATWMRETVQKARALVGLRSSAPLIRALDAVLEGDGSRLSKEMLSAKGPAGGNFQDIAATLGERLNDAKSIKLPAGYIVGDLFNNAGKVSWWHKTVGTMHNLAERSPPFKRVYDAAQQFLNDVSSYAAEAADLAPKILPKMESWRDLAKSPLSAEDTKALSAPVFEGTLVWTRDASGKPVRVKDVESQAAGMDTEAKVRQMLREGKVTEAELKRWQALPVDSYDGAVRNRFESAYLRGGIVWTDAELKAQFGLTPAQIGLYREFRAATDKSLNDLATSDMIRFAGKDGEAVRQQMLDAPSADAAAMILRDHLYGLAEQNPDRAEVLNDTASKIVEKADRVKDLIAKGYAPLSRFGNYFVSVKRGDEQVFFSLYESKLAAAGAARRMRAEYPDAQVSNGTMPQEAFKMFAGVSPETLELFGEMLGLEGQGDAASHQAFQEYLKRAKNNRSAMKRLIERKGIAGFSEDAGRVLAGFIYSNARQTSQNLNAREMSDSLLAIKENERTEGELFDTASKLLEYIRNPQEEAGAFRGLLFAQYLGGNIASAMINATQPLMVTFPYLSQFGGVAKAGAQMKRAVQDALAKTTGSAELDAALKKAEADGIVSPQEVHHLMAQAAGRAQLQAGDGTRVGDAVALGRNAMAKFSLAWGKVFSVAEQYNRRVTFIAAYRTAVDQGIADPFAFAERVVTETQFNYTKAGRPNWARGAIPSVLFTFKTYSVSYVELLHRMYTRGGPEGKRATMLALAMLFLVSGLDGLPGSDDLEDVVDGLLQRLGYNFSTKQAKREFLVGVLGEDGAQFVSKCISGLPGVPIDVSGRMGLGNLIPGTGLLTKKQDYGRDFTELAGPAGDFAKRAGQSAALVVEGEPVKAMMNMAPTAARNLQKAYDMSTTGMYRDDRGRKVIDTDATEAMFKAIGFQPNDVAKVQESTATVQQLVGLNKMMEAEISQKWARGMFEKDQELVSEARDMLRQWNEDNPSSQIRITSMQVLKRVKQMRMSKEERIAKTAPAEIRQAVREELGAR